MCITSDAALLQRIKQQNNEFDAAALFADAVRAHNRTPVVDDDYPAVRHRYESALQQLINALRTNGRL